MRIHSDFDPSTNTCISKTHQCTIHTCHSHTQKRSNGKKKYTCYTSILPFFLCTAQGPDRLDSRLFVSLPGFVITLLYRLCLSSRYFSTSIQSTHARFAVTCAYCLLIYIPLTSFFAARVPAKVRHIIIKYALGTHLLFFSLPPFVCG